MIKKSLILFVFFISTFKTKADEGMWLLSLLNQLNIGDMQTKGFQLTADDVYHVNKASLKDAVAGLGNISSPFRFSCTSELISPEGLLLTNHHCGYSEVQEHSNMENNYVKTGFWAATLKDELPNPGITASFLIRMEEVTKQTLEGVDPAMTETERAEIIKNNNAKIEEAAIAGTQYVAKVSDFFNGNKYYLMVYITYKDVRLVGVPPSSIGKFGGDTDNWMWPRHTGDFLLFRIYTAPNGDPAEYAEENVPLKSKHFFPLSIKGVKNNDFAMVMGYPGSTDRYLSSWGVKQTMNMTNQARIDVRTPKLDIIKEDMLADPELFIKYTSKYNQSSNYWKYSIGQNKGLRRLQVIDKKKKIERELEAWIYADPERKEKYGDALDNIHDYIVKHEDLYYASQYFNEALLYEGPEIVMMAYYLSVYLRKVQENPIEALEELKQHADKHFKNYNAATDEKLMASLFELYSNKVDEKYHPDIFGTVKSDFDGDFKNFAAYAFNNTVLTSKEKLYNFIEMEDMSHLLNASDALRFASGATQLVTIVEENKLDENTKNQILEIIEKVASGLDINEDISSIVEQLNYTVQNVEKSKRPDVFETIERDFNGDFNKFATALMKKSIFANKKNMEKFLKKPSKETIINDLAFMLVTSISENLKDEQSKNDMGLKITNSILQVYFSMMNDDETMLQRGERLFTAALMEMYPQRKFYPDANSTLRLTYGTVSDYKPSDAVRYKHYTTLKGIIEKENPESHEFAVDEKLKELYEKKDYGIYGDNGQMNVCFITDNDITGGNSGSPVLNSNGELIGVAFDGNWEAMSGDIAFEPELQKCISVDIRYVLFIIDKFAGAQRLIDEVSIVK